MNKQTALQILTDLSQGVNISDPTSGLCYNFEAHPLNLDCIELPRAFASILGFYSWEGYFDMVAYWPLYSGNRCYPIPHPLVTDPETVYCSHKEYRKWDLSTVYGQNRQNFCLFLIGEINGQP